MCLQTIRYAWTTGYLVNSTPLHRLVPFSFLHLRKTNWRNWSYIPGRLLRSGAKLELRFTVKKVVEFVIVVICHTVLVDLVK